MGGCASAPLEGPRRGPSGTPNASTRDAPASCRHSPSAQEKRSTADTIAAAFVAQADAQPEPAKSLAQRLASRSAATESRRASTQATHLGIGPSPAAESLADLGGFQSGTALTAFAPKARQAADCPDALSPPCHQDSFEATRLETMRRLELMEKNFRGSAAAAAAWASPAEASGGGGGGSAAGGPRALSPLADGRGASSGAMPPAAGSGTKGSASGAPAAGMSQADTAARGDEDKEEEAEVVAMEVGRTGSSSSSTKLMVIVMGEASSGGEEEDKEAIARHGSGLRADPSRSFAMLSTASPRAVLLGSKPSMRQEGPCALLSREGADATCPGTITPVVSTDRCTASGAAPFAAGNAAAAAAVASGGATIRSVSSFKPTPGGAGGAAAGGAGDAALAPPAAGLTGDVQPETDELTSLPLPNLVRGPPRHRQATGTSSCRSSKDFRHSGSSYSPASESDVWGSGEQRPGKQATRSSDLGFYFEEARLNTTAPARGTKPVRHHILDSPMVAQRMAGGGAQAAEGGGKQSVVLDYVPVVKRQPSRGNLLLPQQSQKHIRWKGDEAEEAEAEAAARRLEYRPTKSFIRRSSSVAPAPPYLDSPVRGAQPTLLLPTSPLSSSHAHLAPTTPLSPTYASASASVAAARFSALSSSGLSSSAAATFVSRRGVTFDSASTFLHDTVTRGGVGHSGGAQAASGAGGGSLDAAASAASMPYTPSPAGSRRRGVAAGGSARNVSEELQTRTMGPYLGPGSPPAATGQVQGQGSGPAAARVALFAPLDSQAAQRGSVAGASAATGGSGGGSGVQSLLRTAQWMDLPLQSPRQTSATLQLASPAGTDTGRRAQTQTAMQRQGPLLQQQHRPSAPQLQSSPVPRLKHQVAFNCGEGRLGSGGDDVRSAVRRPAQEMIAGVAWADSPSTAAAAATTAGSAVGSGKIVTPSAFLVAAAAAPPAVAAAAAYDGGDAGAAGTVTGNGNGSRAVARAARLLASLQRLGMVEHHAAQPQQQP